MLSQDIKARCSLVLKELMMDFAGDMNSLRRIFPKILESTLVCKDGDCSRYSSHSTFCNAGVTNNWWTRSMFLASNRLFNLNMNDNDKHLLLEILKMKVSVAAVEQMKLFSDTQKYEAVNQALSVSLPKMSIFLQQCKRELHQQFTGLIMVHEHIQLRNVKMRVLSCQHGMKRALQSLDVEADIPEIMLRNPKLLNINSFNTVTKFKNIWNISV